jgi:hypothetical protein
MKTAFGPPLGVCGFFSLIKRVGRGEEGRKRTKADCLMGGPTLVFINSGGDLICRESPCTGSLTLRSNAPGPKVSHESAQRPTCQAGLIGSSLADSPRSAAGGSCSRKGKANEIA